MTQKTESLSTEFQIVSHPRDKKKARALVSEFNNRFPYLQKFSVQHRWEANAVSGSRSKGLNAQINYQRDKNLPIRILLFPQLFNLAIDNQVAILLHEWAHHETLPDLGAITEYQRKFERPLLQANGNKDFQNIVEPHNRSMFSLFKIIHIPGEIHAEVWLFKNQNEYSRMEELKAAETAKENLKLADLFPNHRTAHYRLIIAAMSTLKLRAIARDVRFDFTDDHEKVLEATWAKLLRHYETIGLSHPEIVRRADEYLSAVRYGNEDFGQIIAIYEDSVRDFGLRSAPFFPPGAKEKVEKYYGDWQPLPRAPFKPKAD